MLKSYSDLTPFIDLYTSKHLVKTYQNPLNDNLSGIEFDID
jgi:hypothetical protein